MRTEHVEYLLPDYLKGMLEESLRPGVESHLAECAACRAELEQLRPAMALLDSLEVRPPYEGYFSAMVPRVRERLQRRRIFDFVTHPLFARFAVPLAVGALLLVILLRVPDAVREAGGERNPLQAVVHGLETEDLVDVVLDQQDRQAISGNGENETNSMLAVPFLQGDLLLAGADQLLLSNESVLDAAIPEHLDQLSPSEVDVLVARLGERTIL
ncbi:MAG: zf-HC2 domain-containing protein [Ignavibacteriales bacterium]|nr:zf-HC2 domain-containing protein [Ignavibacteriales bacterium]